MFKAPIFATVCLAAVLTCMSAAQARNTVLFIFDASNSMWGQIDGVAKIETARETLNEALAALESEAGIGLLAFGHRRSGDCDDVEVLADVDALSGAELQALVDGITPRGRTPLAGSLRAGGDLLIGRGTGGGAIVLISDGIETCGGDPCGVAAELRQSGVEVRVHTVGFDVDAEAERQLACIAEAGGGRYFHAADGPALRTAMAEVRQVAQAQAEPEPEPAAEPEAAPEPEPEREVVFRDDFSSGDLDEHWEVVNPNPDFFIVEGGELLLVNDGVYGFQQQETPNLMRIDHPLPDGDWDLVVRFKAELKTGQDNVWIGLHSDSDNFMGAQFWTQRPVYDRAGLTLMRRSGEAQSEFVRYLPRGGLRDVVQLAENDGVVLTMHKRGRQYGASLSFIGQTDEDGDPIVHRTDTLTSLRPPGRYPALAVGQYRDTNGETLIFVDSVEIVQVGD